MAKIEDKDKGWGAITRELRSLASKTIRVGIIGEAAQEQEPDGTSVADIAMFNEFGTEDIPARPFLRSTFDEKLNSYENQIARGLKTLGVDMSAEELLERLGLRMVADVQRKITRLKDPPNAPSTVASKGSSNPLIDTGRMRQSVTHEVE